MGWGVSTVLQPRSPAKTRGAGATYRWARPPGAAARPGRVRRALSLGRKRNHVARRRALTRRLLCGEQQAARLGPVGRRAEGARGRRGRISPTQKPGSEGDRECRLESSRRGARSRRCRRRRCRVPEHQLLSGYSGPRSRRLRGSAPRIPPACPLEKELRGRPAREMSVGGLGVRGPEVQGGRRGKRRRVPIGGGDR